MTIDKYLLSKASKEVKPIYAQALFFVSLKEISYYLIFDYYDKFRYYEKVVLDEKLYEEEMNKLYYNMNEFLKEEEILFNNSKCKPLIKMVDIGFRGNFEYPFISFLISFEINLIKGKNTYENKYKSEYTEYDYNIYWYFPNYFTITDYDLGELTELVNNVLISYVKKGTKTKGYEKISFIY